MTDAAAFLAAILDNPADDTHRLVYADFLDEQDDRVPCPKCGGEGTGHPPPVAYPAKERRAADGRVERYIELPPFDYRIPKCSTCSGSRSVPAGNAARAEFIRCQVELAKWEPCNPAFEPTGLPALRARERELLATHGRAWSGEVADALGVDRAGYHERAGWFSPQHTLYGDGLPATGWKFERGFVGSVRLPTSAEFIGDRACGKCVKGWVWTGELDGETGHRIETPCLSCGGLGRVRACPRVGDVGPGGGDVCDLCAGSGILPALAPALARVPGVAAVEIGDRVPEPSNRYPGWFHWREGGNEPESVPEPVFKLLVRTEWPHPDGDVGDDVFAYYRTAALATSALALAGGGLLAGLRTT